MHRLMPHRIVTVTLNPAVDESIAVDEFVLGDVNRCSLGSLDAGGKGLNASRVIHRLGRATLALGFVGGVTGAMIRRQLDEEGVAHAFDDVDEPTRLNIVLHERAARRRTRIYLPGARVEPARIGELLARLALVPSGSVVVLGGAIPPGLADDVYAKLIVRLRESGVQTILDASGSALKNALRARPLLIKPDIEEAAQALGRKIADDDDAFVAACELRRLGAEYVVVSQGAAGAIGVGPDGAWKAVAPVVVTQSTVGSGDSMVAGLAIAFSEGKGLAEGLILGTAAGAGTAMTPAHHLCRGEDFERLLPLVRIRPCTAQAIGA